MTCPARKDEADWLVELTGEAGSPYRSIEGGGPVTAAEFQARWRESDGGRAVREARQRPYLSWQLKGEFSQEGRAPT